MKANELNFLVIEDNDFQRKMIVNMLHMIKANSVVDAPNGKIALEILRTEKGSFVDIVICDLNMPVMDGIEFLKHLGQSNHKASVVLISALGNKLLNSVGSLSAIYGVKLLGIMDKPMNQKIFEELLLEFA